MKTMKRMMVAAGLLMMMAGGVRGAVTDQAFGKMADGAEVRIFTLSNAKGMELRVMTYGATVVSLKTPDRAGKSEDVVLGFDSLDGYLKGSPFFGAVVGRYGNRIAGAKFSIDGVEYKVTANDRGNILHGGRKGFDKVLWTGTKIDDQTVEFTYVSKDGEEGFPGTLTAHARYSLSDANEMRIDYSATTDKATVVNLTNHSYFNFAGQGNGDVLKQELIVDAEQYMPTNGRGIPAGGIVGVKGTPFDFTEAHAIGERIGVTDEQLKNGNGYDHNFVLRKKEGLRSAATVYDPTSGRVMEILTTEPGLQFYSGNGLGGVVGKDGKTYGRRSAFCLEPQHFPDSPNHPEFPSVVLRPGQEFKSTSVYRFSAR